MELEKKLCDVYERENLKVTPRIAEGLLRVLTEKLRDDPQMSIKSFLLKKSTLSFVEHHQPDLSPVPEEVVGHVQTYFKENLSAYAVAAIYRRSNHPDDHELYCVAGRKSDGTYACWTSWSEATQSLNHGHYGLKSFDMAERILKENFVDITGDVEVYGMAKTRAEITNREREVDMEQTAVSEETESRDDKIVPFRRRGAGR